MGRARWVTLSPLAAAAVPLVVMWWRWRDGWLILLDWAPGPRGGPQLGLPVGPVPAAVAEVASWFGNAVGWLPILLALAVAAAGAVAASGVLRADGRPLGVGASTVAAMGAVANPLVATRAYAGQVGVLWAYALVLWLLWAILRGLERRDRSAWLLPGLLWAGAAAATVQALVIGAVPMLVGAWLRRRRLGVADAWRWLAAATATAAVLTAAWLVPALLVGPRGGEPTGGTATEVFRTRGSGLVAWFGAITGSGFWREPAAALLGPSIVVGVVLLVGALGALGAGRGWTRDGRHLLAVSAAVAAVAAMAGHGPLARPWAWLVDHVAAVGVFREPGKWSLLAVAALVLATALAVDRLERSRQLLGGVAAIGVSVLALLAASAVAGNLEPSQYPEGWESARRLIDDDCRIAVLGDGAYLDTGFTDGRVVANPAIGFFGDRAVVSGDTRVDGLSAARDDTPAQRWLDRVNGRYLAGGSGAAPTPDDAAAAGVGWVFVARPGDDPDAAEDLRDAGFEELQVRADGGLWHVPGGCSAQGVSS